MNYEKLFFKSVEVQRIMWTILLSVGSFNFLVGVVFDIDFFVWYGFGLISSSIVLPLLNLLILHPYWREMIDYYKQVSEVELGRKKYAQLNKRRLK